MEPVSALSHLSEKLERVASGFARVFSPKSKGSVYTAHAPHASRDCCATAADVSATSLTTLVLFRTEPRAGLVMASWLEPVRRERDRQILALKEGRVPVRIEWNRE